MVANHKLQGIQVLRAVAALCVLVHHAIYYSGLASRTDMTGFLRINLGGIGVYVFFVISGVVMAMAGGDSAGRFALRRIMRIYPPFIAAVFLGAVIVGLGGLHALQWDWSFLLVPSGTLNSGPQVPYWTLIYEMTFYTVITAVILARLSSAARACVMVAWIVAIAAYAAYGPSFLVVAPRGWQILVSPLCLYFASGYVLGLAMIDGNAKSFAAFGGIAGLCAVLFAPQIFNLLAYSAMACGAIYLSTVLEVRWPRALVTAGDWSYGIYLMHLPTMYLMFLLFNGSSISFWSMLALCLAGGGLVGSAFGFLEFTAHRQLVRRWKSGRAVSAPTGAVNRLA